MEVYTSSGISTSLSVTQGGREVTVNQEQAYFHLKQDGEKLQLYVPKSRTRRQACLSTELPSTLLKYLGARTFKVGELGNMIMAQSLSTVKILLDMQGIINIPGLEQPIDDSGYESDSSDDVNTLSSASSHPQPTPSHDETASQVSFPESLSSPRTSPSVVQRTVALTIRETHHSPVVEERRAATPVTTLDGPESLRPQEFVDQYKKLLEVLVRQARGLSDFPNFRETAHSRGADDNELDIVSAVSSTHGGEKKKIGAAGELFVCIATKLIRLLFLHHPGI